MKLSKLILPVFILFLFSFAQTTEAKDIVEEKPEIVAITMHADWCGTCQSLNPKVEEVKVDFEDKGVLFTRFDFTDEFTIKQTELMAGWIGVDDLFQERKEAGATGFIILVDANTHEVLGRITNEKDSDGIREAISALL